MNSLSGLYTVLEKKPTTKGFRNLGSNKNQQL